VPSPVKKVQCRIIVNTCMLVQLYPLLVGVSAVIRVSRLLVMEVSVLALTLMKTAQRLVPQKMDVWGAGLPIILVAPLVHLEVRCLS